MRENSHKNFFEFIKKYLENIDLKFSLHYIAYPALFLYVVFSIVSYVTATTPNPGHPWSEVGDGVFAVTNNQTVARTYTFPDADATILTSNSAVTVIQGGTGLSSIPDKTLLVTTADNTLSALVVGAGQSIRRNASDTAFEAYTPISTSGFVATDQSTPQIIGSTGSRLLKLWATDIAVTNAIAGSVTGNAGTVTNGVYTNTANVFSQLNPLTTPAESWIGPSSTSGIYFKNANVGIGTTSPTAALHLKAGTATAGTAPLKFTSGPLLSTPESGVLQYLTDTFYITGTDKLNVAGTSTLPVVQGTTSSGGDLSLRGNSANLTSGKVKVLTQTASTSSTTGAFTVAGGVGVTGSLYLGGKIAQVIGLDRNSTAATAGLGLTLSSGGAIAGTADLAGGDLNLKSGISTGSGTSAMRFFTATAGTPGVTDNAPTEKMTILGNGNVGIGTTSPEEKLRVSNGFILVDNGYGILGKNSYGYTTPIIHMPLNDIVIGHYGLVDKILFNVTSQSNALVVEGTGNVGVGVSGPTAALHLKAGTAAAGTAPLKLTAGTKLSSPEEGAIEFDGTHFYGTVGTTRYQLDQQSGGSSGGSVVKIKAGNEVLTNSIVLQDDDELYFSIGANEDWAFRFVVLGYASGTPDFRFAVSAPTGATCYVAAIGAEEHQTTPTVGCGVSTEIVQAASAIDVFEIVGSVKNGSTAGAVTLQWAQGAKFVSDITVYAGSTLYAFKTVGADIAEVYYTKEEGLTSGTLVSLEGSSLGSAVKKSKGSYDRDLIGVVTTSPGLVLSNPNSRIEGMKDVWVALSGRAPVKVNTSNGPIRAGDFITSSDVPGVAMKATKSGPIIGQAMTHYDEEGEGQIIAFLKNGFSNGSSSAEILNRDLALLDVEDTGKYVLIDFMEKKEQLGNSVNISEIFTDRLMAGLEIISPKILTDELGVARISSSNDNREIKFNLREGGALVIANDNTGSEEELVRFDSTGNVNFKGKITAKEIEAESIKGIDSITNRITLLSEGQEAMTLTASAVSILSDTIQALGIDVESIKNELGNLSQQFVSMTEDSVLFDNRVNSLEEILFSETLSGFSSISVLDLETTGNSKFSGLTSFEGDVSFLNKISFEGQLEFKIPPLFNKDTAGFAVIKEEEEEVRISFDQEYMTPPVVSVNITFDKKVEAFDRASFFSSDFKFVVIDKDKTGFTIILNKKATRDIQFSWIALSVRDPKIFESIIEGVIIEESGSEAISLVDNLDQIEVEDLPEILIIEEATSEEFVPEEEVGDISI